MTATPTPGDLSARLQHLIDASECTTDADTDEEATFIPVKIETFLTDMREAIAALSALPAAGGAMAIADEIMRQVHHGATVDWRPNMAEIAGRVRALATTPQPSAAVLEDGGPPCSTHPDAPHGFNRNASHTEDRYVCDCEGWKPDAAVGAQGDGELAWQNIENAEAEFLRNLADKGGLQPLVSGMLRHCARLLDRSATPAAGKGEDDLLDLATLYGDHSVDSRNRESWDFDAHGLKQLAAALTRQPVAGDGWRPIETAPQVESMLSDIPRCLVYSKDFGIQMGRAWRYADGEARGQGDGFNGEWNVTRFHPLPAAPAATPTDGGEGS